jgi:hypothetical protein
MSEVTVTLKIPAALAARLEVYARLLETSVEDLALTALRALVREAREDTAS